MNAFGLDIADRCRWALAHNDGHPRGVWSTGEQLAVALVLRDHEHLAAMGYTVREATERVRGGMLAPPPDMRVWLVAVRAEIGAGW